MGSLSLFQGIFPTQGSNPGLQPRSPTLQADSLPAEPSGKPKNTGVGSLSLLQQIFATQELNWGLLHCRQILYQLSYQGSPTFYSGGFVMPCRTVLFLCEMISSWEVWDLGCVVFLSLPGHCFPNLLDPMKYLTDLFSILIIGFHLRIESPGNLNIHEVLQVPLPTLSAIISFFFCGHASLSSPTENWTHGPCSESAVLTTGLPRKSQICLEPCLEYSRCSINFSLMKEVLI